MPPTVNARLPLSLLEAIRRMDTPQDQGETEYVPELRNKRLGLSDTVYLQIRRYTDAVKRGQQIPFAEAAGLGTLIARRPDAEMLFESAGRIFAEDVYKSLSPPLRTTIRAMPGFIGRRLAIRELEGIATRYFGGSLQRHGSQLQLDVSDAVTAANPESSGCTFYGSALRELLGLFVSGGGNVEHVHCTHQGHHRCEWRAEWRGPVAKAS